MDTLKRLKENIIYDINKDKSEQEIKDTLEGYLKYITNVLNLSGHPIDEEILKAVQKNTQLGKALF